MTKGERFVRFMLIILFIAFITIYISQANGYYEYQLHKKSELTNEKIKQFEQDVKDNKPIDLEDYLGIESKNYNNKFSKAGNAFSKTTSKYVKKGIEKIFSIVEGLLSE